MLGPSFQSFRTARLLPGRVRGKQAGLLVALALAAAGCGGGSGGHGGHAKTQTVRGGNYRFTAPSGWNVERKKGRILNATSGDDILSVTAFTLARQARPKLADLDRTVRELAQVLGGKVTSSRGETAAGKPVRVYALKYKRLAAEVAFVFRGRNEFELFCQYRAGSSPARCREFRKSFRPI
jgi:hypothetical protein